MLRRLAGQLASRAALQPWCSATATSGAAAELQPLGSSLASLGAPAAQQLPAAWLQRAGLRTHRHVAHIGRLRKPRSTLHRALAALGKAAGVATLGLPLAGAAALVVAGRDDAEAVELVRSLPRTARVVGWGAWATWQASVGGSMVVATADPQLPLLTLRLARCQRAAPLLQAL